MERDYNSRKIRMGIKLQAGITGGELEGCNMRAFATGGRLQLEGVCNIKTVGIW